MHVVHLSVHHKNGKGATGYGRRTCHACSADEGREPTFLRTSSASAWSLSDSGSTWDMQEPILIAVNGGGERDGSNTGEMNEVLTLEPESGLTDRLVTYVRDYTKSWPAESTATTGGRRRLVCASQGRWEGREARLGTRSR
jgi:hypothetical protein